MEETTKAEIKKIMENKGEVRGAVFQTDAEYVRQQKGEEGLKAIEKKTKEFGYPINYAQIKTMDWYPLGLRAISLLAAKEAFNWGDKEIENMGNAAPKYSFIVKLLMKYFLSFPMTYKQSPTYWEKHYTVGVLEAPDYDLEKKYYIIRLKDFKVHPILCVYLEGYFMRIGQFVLKGKNFRVKETKCMFKGDPYHEFVVEWE